MWSISSLGESEIGNVNDVWMPQTAGASASREPRYKLIVSGELRMVKTMIQPADFFASIPPAAVLTYRITVIC